MLLISFFVPLIFLSNSILAIANHLFKLLNSTNNESSKQRIQQVRTALSKVTGIFNDIEKVVQYRTQDSVLVAVVSLQSATIRTSKYGLILNNWFCFMKHYNYKNAIYIAPERNFSFENQTQLLRSMGIDSNFLPYPVELFWSIVRKKSNGLQYGYHRCTYEGDLPSMDTYGGLIKIVPLLEVLQLGNDILFLDVDVAVIHDIIPAIIKGNADINFSLELKSCFYPSHVEHMNYTDWTLLEPNSGVMFVRSKPSTIVFFERWIQATVDSNYCNEQRLLVPMEFYAKIDFSCNDYLRPFSYHLKREVMKSQSVYKSRLKRYLPYDYSQPNATFCYLNELEFQNGKVALNCARGKNSCAGEYVLAMLEQRFPANYSSNPRDYLDYVADIKYNNSSNGDILMSPKIIHANYCDDKVLELKSRGLWLVNYSISASTITKHRVHDDYVPLTCRKYDYSESIYGKVKDWREKVAEADKEIKGIHAKLSNGTLIRFPHKRRIVYLVIDGELREFPDHDTFVAHGYQYNQVVNIGDSNILYLFPIGHTLPAVKTAI